MIDSFRGRYHFLSNFYPLIVEFRGKSHSSVEAAFQSEKCRFTNKKYNVMKTLNCGGVRSIERNNRMDWEKRKVKTMELILRSKFNIPKLKKLLKKTYKHKIVNVNCWHDVFWGVCMCSKHRGTGQNMLGWLLMKIRNDLLKGTKTDKINSPYETLTYLSKTIVNDNLNFPVFSNSLNSNEALQCEFCEYFEEAINFHPLQF